MTAGSAKTLVRVFGTMAGAYGAFLVLGSLLLLRPVFRGEWVMALFVALPLLLGVYCLCVGYLAWRRLSPLAVRHVCGTVGYVFLLSFIGIMGKVLTHPVEPSPIWAVGFLGTLLLVHFFYRVASERLSRLLFPHRLSEGQT